MPLSGKYTARLLVANGNISEQFSPGRLSVDAETSDTVVLATQTILDDLYLLADFIQNDDFWKAYVEQVYINQKQEIEMIPKLGSFVILLGTIEGYQTKFRNLRAFLETGLSREGWNKYSYINLKYNNQVVCTKSEVYDVQE
jgi:cell division protein FtsQ